MDFCLSLDSSWKLKHGKTRYILREYLKNNHLNPLAKRADKAILTYGLLSAIKSKDIEKIRTQIDNIHEDVLEIIDKNKLMITFEKLEKMQVVKGIDVTNLLTFFSTNIWLHKSFQQKDSE